MPKDPDLVEQVIGDITGLQIAMEAMAGRLAALSEKGNDDLKQINQGAQSILAGHEVHAPNKDADAIRARAEQMIDQIFGVPQQRDGGRQGGPDSAADSPARTIAPRVAADWAMMTDKLAPHVFLVQ